MSRQCGTDERIRLLSVFARRPKITRPADDRIIVKFNGELFDVARFSRSFGIPVLAAVPVVSSILDVTLEAPCQWFHLTPSAQEIHDVELTLTPDGALNDQVIPDAVTGPLNAEELVTIVRETTRPVTWDEGIRNLRKIRSSTNVKRGTFPFFGGYKPFNIMAMER